MIKIIKTFKSHGKSKPIFIWCFLMDRLEGYIDVLKRSNRLASQSQTLFGPSSLIEWRAI